MDEPQPLTCAPDPAEPARRTRAARLTEFEAHLQALSPRVVAMPTIVALNVLVFVIMVANGINAASPGTEDLLHMGANFGPKTTNGEWWRLLSANYLHIGFMHLAFNMWALLSAGALVERLLGTLGFVIVYTISGVAGSLASCFWDPWVVSAGASGAIFGVWGALLGFLLLRRDSVPLEALAHLRSSGLAFVGYNLVFGFFIPHIDMAGHIGGLIAGFFGGLALSRPLRQDALAGRPLRNLVVAGIGLGLVVVFIIVAPPAAADVQAEFIRFGEAEERVLKAHGDLFKKIQASAISEAALADTVDREILPEWRTAGTPILLMTRVHPDQKKLVEASCRYINTRREAWEALVEAIRKDDRQKSNEFKQKWAEANRICNEIVALTKEKR